MADPDAAAGSVVINSKNSQSSIAFDLEPGCDYVDLVARGVIDPVKVTRSALRNAASIASMVLTTDTLVVEKKEPKPEETGHGHGHGHGH